RVRLERNLAIVGDIERVVARADDASDFVGLEQRRRAAAEVDRVGAAFLIRGAGLYACLPNLRDQRIDVPLLQRGVEQPAVEIAVVADGRTERNVNVQPEHGNLVIG